MSIEPSGAKKRLADGIATLFPGYFALVMATGIVSIAASLESMPAIAFGLFVVDIGAYAILSVLLLVRLVFHPRAILDDLRDHGRGPGFFTVVAATCVLGSQTLVVGREPAIARGLWLAGITLWVIVMYGFFTATIVREKKPTLDTGINGAWLLAIVATQSVSVLGASLLPWLGESAPLAVFVALSMYLLGAMLYLTIITLIFYRFTFLELPMERLTPPYWINMGAVAITTLAGSTLLLTTESSPLLDRLRPFLTGFTLFFWVTATWWIPLLLILGFYRHVIRKFPVRYDPQYWGMVFPVGMYTVCTYRLSVAIEQPFLLSIPAVTVYVALALWAATFVAMLASFKRPSA